MREPSDDRIIEVGIILVLLHRLTNYLLPYGRQLQVKVGRGELLTQYEMRFLKQVLEEGVQASRLAAKHAKYESLVSQATSLYSEIVNKGVENERAASQHPPAPK